MDSLVQTVCVFSEDVEMEFHIEKCTMLVMEKGKIVKSVVIELPDGNVIKLLYLGILETDFQISILKPSPKLVTSYFFSLPQILTI